MSPQEFEQALHDAEVKLARLKALYEQWFQGLEKMEPGVARKDLDRTLDMLKKNVPRNTALRFRMQQLVARYGTYGIYWSRIARQIEEGTLRRDLQRVQKKRAQSNARPADQVFELDVDVELDDELDSEKTDPGIVATPSAPAQKPMQKPSLGFDESDLDAILGTLAPPGADEPKVRSARPLSPFAMGGSRPPMVTPAGGAASATFGKPKDKAVVPASTVQAPPPAAAAIPKPAPMPAIPKPVAPPIAAIPKPVPAMPMPAAPRPMPAIPKPAAAPVAPPRPAPSSAELDESRMRAIYSRYVDARRQNNERTDVRYESLAESVQKMMPKLREKHAGKPIDFEIVLQNGKVGLKPKVGG